MNNTLFEYITVINVVRSAIVTIFAYFLLSISVYSALIYCISEEQLLIRNNSIIGALAFVDPTESRAKRKILNSHKNKMNMMVVNHY